MNIFVDYYVDKDKCATNNSLTMAKRGVLKSLEKRLNDETNADKLLQTISRFYVQIPLCFSHLNHPVGESATMAQYVDKRILDRIFELPSHNVTNVAEVKRCLDRRKTRSLGMWQMQRSPKRQIGGIIHPAKISKIILHGQFLHRSTVTRIKSLSASRFVIGKKDLLKRGSSIEQETIQPPHLIQQGKTPLKRAPFFLSIKSHGSSDC